MLPLLCFLYEKMNLHTQHDLLYFRLTSAAERLTPLLLFSSCVLFSYKSRMRRNRGYLLFGLL